MSTGSILKIQRQERGISQLQLAEQLHVSRQSISSWENDRAYPSLDNLIALSELYRISIDDLLKDNEELRQKIERNQKRIQQYDEHLMEIDTSISEIQKGAFDYEKKDEFLFCLTLICLGILLLPLGPVIPISYFIVKRNSKKGGNEELDEK